MCPRILLYTAILSAWLPCLFGQATPSLTATPASLTFTYQLAKGTSTPLPAAQTIAIKRSGTGTALPYTISVTYADTIAPIADWLIVSPMIGNTGGSVSVRVNPTSLSAGTYVATITINAPLASGPINAGVVLAVKNPAPAMSVAPATLTYTWRTDQGATVPPSPQPFTVSTDGEPFTFTATVAGGTWLSVNPAIGVVISGSPITADVAIDKTGLVPGQYTGKITIASSTASNRTVVVSVNLTVNPGPAVINAIWPIAAQIGSNDTVITIRGSQLFKTSVVRATATATTDLVSTWISTDVMVATIPKALLNATGTINIFVQNPSVLASANKTFTVTPIGPQLVTIVNAASFAMATTPNPQIAPGELLTIYGSGLGPTNAILGTPVGAQLAYPTTLGTPAVKVVFQTDPAVVDPLVWPEAPLLMSQANQISCQAPFTITNPASGLKLRVTYDGNTSADFLYDAVSAEPGIFTLDSSGRGQAAALNYESATSEPTLNSASNPASKGKELLFYVTGAGAISKTPNPEGQLSAESPEPGLVVTPTVTIGGESASIVSANAVGGAIGGLAYVRVTVPSTLAAAKDHAVVVSINGRSSPATATVAVK